MYIRYIHTHIYIYIYVYIYTRVDLSLYSDRVRWCSRLVVGPKVDGQHVFSRFFLLHFRWMVGREDVGPVWGSWEEPGCKGIRP